MVHDLEKSTHPKNGKKRQRNKEFKIVNGCCSNQMHVSFQVFLFFMRWFLRHFVKKNHPVWKLCIAINFC